MRLKFDDEDLIKKKKNKVRDSTVTAFIVLATTVFAIFLALAEYAKISIWYKINFQ